MPSKPLFNKVAIVGVGLIGGSLGLAIKKHKLARWVIGSSRTQETIKNAIRVGAIDVGMLDWKEAVADADMVILAAPVSTIISQLQRIDSCLKRGALVIDVGSSKTEIQRVAAKHIKRGRFVGCHPMAGSEKKGILHANAGMFKDEICFVTTKNAPVQRFWKILGSDVFYISPSAHDQWVASASHLPHILAFSLFANAELKTNFPGRLNPSIRDFARIARGSAPVWADIFLSNRDALLKSMERFLRNFSSWVEVLKKQDHLNAMKLIAESNRVSWRIEELEKSAARRTLSRSARRA